VARSTDFKRSASFRKANWAVSRSLNARRPDP
jgi:hypothetical protein